MTLLRHELEKGGVLRAEPVRLPDRSGLFRSARAPYLCFDWFDGRWIPLPIDTERFFEGAVGGGKDLRADRAWIERVHSYRAVAADLAGVYDEL